ncbi:hypothetical protein MN032_00135 [Agromyces atrinae]|uniref:hypothetical protein n=1 Tax=Agromyces atrinae TaxID=592376 RepID=UPI001F58D2DE|nr:hypothetical protein [Agromyces atrinae]MCI2956087.1 hypothetical protein [Agromyces atrinae]
MAFRRPPRAERPLPTEGRKQARRRWITAGVIVFVAIDAALVAWALSPSAPEVRPQPDRTAEAAPTPTASPTETPAPFVAPELRLLEALDSSTAWRAVPGSCGGAEPVVESTADGGATWQASATAPAGIREVLAIDVVAGGPVSLVAKTGDDCRVTVFRSFTAGEFWEEAPGELGTRSYVDPADRVTVVIDGVATPQPCAPAREVARSPVAVAVLCDGDVRVRANDALDWSAFAVADVGALTMTDDGAVTIARVADESCAGVALADVASPTVISCVPGESAPTALGIDRVGSVTWVWQGAAVSVQ